LGGTPDKTGNVAKKTGGANVARKVGNPIMMMSFIKNES
jgi:hypothetical protein